MGKLHLSLLSAHMLHHLQAAFHITFEMRACYVTLPTQIDFSIYVCLLPCAMRVTALTVYVHQHVCLIISCAR